MIIILDFTPQKTGKTSGQIIMFHQPKFHWNKGISLTKPPFVAINCLENGRLHTIYKTHHLFHLPNSPEKSWVPLISPRKFTPLKLKTQTSLFFPPSKFSQELSSPQFFPMEILRCQCLCKENVASLRENPGLKVKLLVGPTCKIPRSTQRS